MATDKDKTIRKLESENGWLLKIYEFDESLHITDCDDDIVYIPDDLLVKVANEILKFAVKKKLV